MVGVAVAFIAWALVAADPNCTEGPCGSSVVLILGVMAEAAIAVVWLVVAIAVSGRDSHEDDNR
jgi:hypothetical protein